MHRLTSPLHLGLFFSGPPSAALGAARGAVEVVGGAVVEARQFSDLHLHLAVELEAAAAPTLLQALGAAGLRVEAGADTALNAAATTSPGAELRLALGITLAQGKGDVLQTIPAVPG